MFVAHCDTLKTVSAYLLWVFFLSGLLQCLHKLLSTLWGGRNVEEHTPESLKHQNALVEHACETSRKQAKEIEKWLEKVNSDKNLA